MTKPLSLQVLKGCAMVSIFLSAVLGDPAGPTTPPGAYVPDFMQITNLRNRLFQTQHYHKDVPPVVDHKKPINVDISITLVKMNDLDEVHHTMSATYILYKSWQDVRLKWNVSDYGGIENITISIDDLWQPDVSLFNTADQSYDHVYGKDAVVRSDGAVLWAPMLTTKTWCLLNFIKFPFDTQVCYMKFGSWIYAADQMKFKFPGESGADAVEKDAFVYSDGNNAPDVEWKVIEFKQRHELLSYNDFMSEWSEVVITIKLRRLGRYYQSLFVAPIVLLAILNPMVYLLPPDSTEKPILGSFILLAICTLLINLQSIIQPAHVTIPRLVMFYVSTLVLTSVSIFASSIVCHLARKSKRLRGVPGWLGAIFLGRCGLRRVLCVETYSPVSRFDTLLTMGNGSRVDDDIGTEMDGTTVNPSHNELREIRKCLQAIASRMNSDDSIQNLARDWYEIARVLDRLLIVIFYFLLFLTAVAFLL